MLNAWPRIISFFFLLALQPPMGVVFYSPLVGLASSLTRFLDHIQRRATVGRTPLSEWSVRRRDLYLTTHNTHNTNIHALGGIRTHDLSSRAAEDLRLRPHGHWDRPEDNNIQTIKRWKPKSKRPIGRPKTRWEDEVLEDIRSMNVSIWKKVAQHRDSWKKTVEEARTLNRV